MPRPITGGNFCRPTYPASINTGAGPAAQTAAVRWPGRPAGGRLAKLPGLADEKQLVTRWRQLGLFTGDLLISRKTLTKWFSR